MPWTVKLVKRPAEFIWKPDYFPREFRLKTDAKHCQQTVEDLGGEAVIERIKKFGDSRK